MNHQGYTGELLYGVRRRVNLTLGRGATIPRYGMQPYYGMADNHTSVRLITIPRYGCIPFGASIPVLLFIS